MVRRARRDTQQHPQPMKAIINPVPIEQDAEDNRLWQHALHEDTQLFQRCLARPGCSGSSATCSRSPISPPASGAGIAFLVPGGLFELAFPLLLILRSSSGRNDARLVPVSVGGAG